MVAFKIRFYPHNVLRSLTYTVYLKFQLLITLSYSKKLFLFKVSTLNLIIPNAIWCLPKSVITNFVTLKQKKVRLDGFFV